MRLKNEKVIKRDPRVRSYTDSDNKTKYRVRFQRTLFGHKLQFEKRDLPSAYAATAWADHALVEANEKRGILKSPTVEEYYTIWFNRNVQKHYWKPDTEQNYAAFFRRHILPEFGNVRLEDLTRDMFQNYIDRMEHIERPNGHIGYSSKTLRLIKGYFSVMLNDAVDGDYIDANRIHRVRIKSHVGERNKEISLQQYLAAIKAANKVLTPIGKLGFYLSLLGMRHAEILGFTESHLTPTTYFIEKTRTSAAPMGNTPKTFDSKRTIPITSDVYQVAQDAIAASKQIYLECEKNYTPDSFVIVNRDAQPLNYTGLNYFFQKVSDEIGFHIYPHMMRHAFATFSLPKARDPKDVMKILGHSSMTMTEYYDNGTKEGQSNVVSMMDHLINTDSDNQVKKDS
ncbi:tyrosine-type recombinase/integrase [Furfurilactobacillus cerevisiae]|uniref:tyrosine-type recombinase/integrase n=1 Tax=Furfurilactobacillus rossiae TaxID=231049 RepID=UPI003B981984